MSSVLLVGKGAPDRGGIPSFLEMLRNSSLSNDHELEFLNVAHRGTPQGGKASLANVGRTLRDALAVWRAAPGHDIVHIHSAMVPSVTVVRAAVLAAAARGRGCSVILHAHGGNLELWLTRRRRRLLVKLAMRPVHRVVAVWSAGDRALRHVLGEKQVRLIDNGVSLDAHGDPGPEHRPPRVLYVGLLTPRKGVLDLVEASGILHDRGVAHELWLLGGTPDEGPSAENDVLNRLDGRVRLLCTRPPEAMPAVYAQADVFCLPSWWEAMPLTVLEAMASGLPVVATDVGDVSRAVADRLTGLVVPTRSPVELADALEALLKDRPRRRSMGAAGRERVERHFSSGVTARAVSALYAEVAGAHR